jgi:AcrR family transcriptional regulator
VAKQARSQATYDRILDAAAEEFARYGYPNTNLQKVADRTGLTKGALYGHFSSKRELGAALVKHLEAVAGSLLTDTGTASIPALEQLGSLTFTLAERIYSDLRFQAAVRLVHEEARASRRPPQLLEDLRRAAVRLVRQAQQEGHLRASLCPGPVADLIVTMLFGTYCTTPESSGDDLPRKVRKIWDMLLPALSWQELPAGRPERGQGEPH